MIEIDEIELIRRVINEKLNSLSTTSPNKKILISFTKKSLKGVNPKDQETSDSIWQEIIRIKNNHHWLTSVSPPLQQDIEGLKSIKFKIDLSYLKDIANFTNFNLKVINDKIEWKELIVNHLPPNKKLTQVHWGDSPKTAWANICKIKDLLAKNTLSKQQISAYVYGDAKFVTDSALNSLLDVYPELSSSIRTRKVVINYFSRSKPSTCLIVENMDTYHYLQEYIPNDWMLVYGFGNRIAKEDISDLDIVDLHLANPKQGDIHQACLAFWKAKNAKKLYWGDNDKTGLEIFNSLKKQYPNLKKWKSAYDAMNRKEKTLNMKDIHQEAILVDELDFAD
jgi:hypothetical protein